MRGLTCAVPRGGVISAQIDSLPFGRANSAEIDSLPLVGAPTGQMIWAEIAARAGLRARCATAKRMRDRRAGAGQQSGVRDSRANAQQPGGRARPRPLPAAKRSA